jgi:hypothetical protein
MASFFCTVMVETRTPPLGENDAMNQFIKKHESHIVGTLSGWDRVRFRGTIRMLAAVPGLMAWLTENQVRLTGFKQFGLDLTARLKAAVEQIAAAAKLPIRYLASSALSKEDLVHLLLKQNGISEGVVRVFSCVEPCRSFEIRRDRETKTIDLVPAFRRCLHWYVYFVDSVLGLCHVRIQSWLPFTIHICVNGREWLCRELGAAGIGFRRHDNCLTSVEDFETAQQLLDAQPWADWTGMLNGLLDRACPALRDLTYRGERLHYYWSADETEWATDTLFRSPQLLADLYPSLLRHGMTTFSSCDVLRFLGRSRSSMAKGVHGNFEGEVVTDLKARTEGVRIKHSVNRNSIKMYDKAYVKEGAVLRVETTINDARDMKVYRTSESDPSGPKSWRPLRKGVVDLPRRAEISGAANTRYLTALAAVDSRTPIGQLADAIFRPVSSKGRRVRGLAPLVGEDARLAKVLLHGKFSINGFRNRDIRELLFPGTPTPLEQRRLSGKVTRLLRLFRAHGLIQKIRGTHRYQLTAEGQRCLPAFTAARNASAEELNKIAA